MAISGPTPDGSPTVRASGASAVWLHACGAGQRSTMRAFSRSSATYFLLSSSPFLSSLRLRSENTSLRDAVVGHLAARADADELDAAIGLAHGGRAAGLGVLDLSAQSGGSCGASTRPRSRTVTSIRPLANCRVVSQLVKRCAHGFGLALALAERGCALARRHDEDHLLQHVFGRLGLAPPCCSMRCTASCSLMPPSAR